MRADYTWDVLPVTGQLELRVTATVEGKQLVAEATISREFQITQFPPADYIKRDLERQVLRVVSKELFGHVV